MKPFTILALLAALSILARTAHSQVPDAKSPPKKEATSTRPAPKDASEVLAGMRQALAAEAWSCRCKTPGAGFGMFAAESTLILRHDANGEVTGVRLTGTFTPRGPKFDAASADGAKIRVADLDEKVYEDAPWSAEATVMAAPGLSAGPETLRWTVPLCFWQPSDLMPEEKDSVKLSGTATSDGVLCDVIEMQSALPSLPEMSEPASEVVRFIVGRDDRLPRRITKKWPATGPGAITSSMSHELTAWNRSPKIEARTFEIDVAGMKPGKFKGPSAAGGPSARGGPDRGDGPSFAPKKGDRPSDFALKDSAGKEYKLSAYKGKVVLVHFSQLESPASVELLSKMKAKHGEKLVILDLVVDRDGGDGGAKGSKKLAFPRLLGGESVADAWGINLFSSGVVIGPDGKVAATFPTGLAGGAVDSASDLLIRKMGDYLKNPSKGW
jgi:hypothetical protein